MDTCWNCSKEKIIDGCLFVAKDDCDRCAKTEVPRASVDAVHEARHWFGKPVPPAGDGKKGGKREAK